MKHLPNKIRDLLEMIRFSHTIFALPFALLAALIAWNTPAADGSMFAFRLQDLVGILACMVAARSAAMAFNRLVDRHLDAQNPRTRNRHLPSGALTVPAVAWFTIISCLAFVLGTLLFLPNRLPLLLSLPVLGVLLMYSYTKRFTWLSHAWLGFALMLAPVATWIAVRGGAVTVDLTDMMPAFVLGFSVLFWVTGFDIIYACQDYEFDRQAKLKSLPAAVGVTAALRVAAVCHFVMIALLVSLPTVSQRFGLETGLGGIYLAGIAVVALLLVYEHLLVRPSDLTRVNIAFFNVNAAVSFGLLVVGAIDLFV